MKTPLYTLIAVALAPFSLLAQSGPPVPPAPPTPAPGPTATPGEDILVVQPEGLRSGSNLSTDLAIENPEALDLTPQVVIYFNMIIDTNATAAQVLQRTRETVSANPSQAGAIVENAMRNAPTEEIAVAIAAGAMQGIPADQAAALAGSVVPTAFVDFAPAVAATMVNTVAGAELKVDVAASILANLPFNHGRYDDVVASVLGALQSEALIMQALQKAVRANPSFAKAILDAAVKAYPNLQARIDALRTN